MASDKENGNSPDSMETNLAEMDKYLTQSKMRQDQLRRWGRWATAAIIFVFATYILLFYQTFRRNLDPAKFTTSIQSGISELAPAIAEASIDVMTEVSPTYLELASQKTEEVLPTFLNKLEKEVDILIANMTVYGEQEIQGRLENILTLLAEEFRKQYPDLTDQQLEDFILETETELQNLFLELSEHIINHSLPEVMEMKYLTESLIDQKLPQDEMEIYRLFLHKMLLLLDKEIMEG